MEKIRRRLLLSIYMFAPPFYMCSLTYLLENYSGRNKFIWEHIFPFFSVTVWVPLVISLLVNKIIRVYRQNHLQLGEKLKDYPLVFVFIYSLYFLAMGSFFWGKDCLYSALGGLLLVFFVLLFQDNTRRCVEYLPGAEKFYFYAVAFLFPIMILMVTDILSFIEKTPYHMAILLSPLSYIGGISLFIGVCLILKLYCVINKVSLKKHVMSLRQAIFVLLIGDICACLYLIGYIGNGIFLTGFSMSVALWFIEVLYHMKGKRGLVTKNRPLMMHPKFKDMNEIEHKSEKVA